MYARLKSVNLIEKEAGHSEFKSDVLQGLSQKQKRLDAKYFYDKAGSGLYDEICRLPEYYPYQAELSILPVVAQELSKDQPIEIVEFGAGSLLKIKTLLTGIKSIRRFIPIDISAEHLNHACTQLQAEFSDIIILPIVSDFIRPQKLPESHGLTDGRIGFFPGSTIGNFGPSEAVDLLKKFRLALGKGARLLIGVDQKKAAGFLHRAYNDEKNTTARFNLNILQRINRELQADFDLERFEHYAFYNPSHGRIEMHLVSKARQDVHVAGRLFRFERGESIHTENSYKYSQAEFKQLAKKAGWNIEKKWVDKDNHFSVYLMYPDRTGSL